MPSPAGGNGGKAAVPRPHQPYPIAPPPARQPRKPLPAARCALAAGVVAIIFAAATGVPAAASPPAETPSSSPSNPPAEAAAASPPAQAPAETPEAAAAPPANPPSAGARPADEAYLAAPVQPAATDPVGSRLIDLATPFTIGRRRLELLVTHRFNQPVNQGSSAHNLWGLDSGADVGIGFAYGLLRTLDVSVYRSQFQEDFELAAKLQVLDQSPHVPLSAAVRAGADLLGRRGVTDPHRPFVQVLLGSRLAAGWNVFVSPSWVRATPLLRDAWNVPVGVTAPLPGKWLLDGEVTAPNHALHGMPGASHLAWHAAFAKRIGWHLFQIVLGNSRATTVDQIVGGDFAGGFTARDVRLGFNLIRYFSP
jgi:hypothetical protein